MLTNTTLWLEEEELAELRRRAQEEHLSMSQLVRLALRKAKIIESGK